jgi:hypothetical protein
MRLLLLVLILISFTGCATLDQTNVAPVTPEAKRHKVKINKKLLEKCPEFTRELKTGSDAEAVEFAADALENGKQCREGQYKLVDWVKDTFELED